MSDKRETSSLEGGLTFGVSHGPYDGRQEAREAKAASPVIAHDFFGDAIPPTAHQARLSAEFTYPPFSVLNARDGWWQERKREWLALGIQSELGRGDTGTNTPHHGKAANEGLISLRAEQKAARKANAMPGGSMRPLDRMKAGKQSGQIVGKKPNATPGGGGDAVR